MNAAIRLLPKSVPLYRSRAGLFERNEDLAHAVQDFTTAIGLEPESPYNLQFRAKDYAAWGKTDEAIADDTAALQLIDALELEFESKALAPELLEQRGDLRAGAGARDQAREDYQAALQRTGVDAARERLRQKLKRL